MAERWTPDSWRKKPIQQVPDYPDRRRWLTSRSSSRLFLRWFLRARRAPEEALGAGREGRRFLLQGGDCAESFAEHGANNIRDFFRVFCKWRSCSPMPRLRRW